MEVHVYDTYVQAGDGHEMHFDVLTAEKNHEKAVQYGREWLKSIGEGDAVMTQKECTFCHTGGATPREKKEIREKGYFIVRMSGCP